MRDEKGVTLFITTCIRTHHALLFDVCRNVVAALSVVKLDLKGFIAGLHPKAIVYRPLPQSANQCMCGLRHLRGLYVLDRPLSYSIKNVKFL